ncbi:arsenate reductase ArsC [Nocardia callitridis]|uniref:Phosphotyrosine protein phosphatase I domain-containing protein n=1 Tax=Nocardia callitridis TaxID=648753 RepID=A0ABP9L1C4_9NOCA
MVPTRSVLFVCTHNAGRSPMAAGLLSAMAGERIEVRSAGITPADAVDPTVVAAMAEVGVDLTAHAPKRLTMDAVGLSDVVVTMGCPDSCPFFPGISYRDWVLPDPAGQDLDAIRAIRDHLHILVENIVAELVPTPTH